MEHRPLVPHQRKLDIEVSARVVLVDVQFVRAIRGGDAESVFDCVGDATHPKFLRWVFNLATNPANARRRELRFWAAEIRASAPEDRARFWTLAPAAAIGAILGDRKLWPIGEIEAAWTTNAWTISKLIKAGELTLAGSDVTRASLAAFLERRLQ